jgi:hypothetical protein
MTDEQINRSVAVACNWQPIFAAHPDPWLVGWQTPSGEIASQLPNVCNDLNAMHEAEEKLEGDLQKGFVYELRWITESKFWGDFKHCHATARQRAEAFLRTLGKWEETK